jgi:hypothetical protein
MQGCADLAVLFERPEWQKPASARGGVNSCSRF